MRRVTRHRQRGVSLVAALFLLVVLALLGAFIVRISVIQHHTVSLALLGAQAHAAALTGIEWAAHEALQGGLCAATTLNLSEGALNGFTVNVSCQRTTHQEGGANYDVFVFESFASAGSYGTPDYVSRTIRTSVTDAP